MAEEKNSFMMPLLRILTHMMKILRSSTIKNYGGSLKERTGTNCLLENKGNKKTRRERIGMKKRPKNLKKLI